MRMDTDMNEPVIRTRFTIEVPTGNGDGDYAAFDYGPETTQEGARESALFSYGEPSKGLMLVRDGKSWATSDGINPGTGDPWTDQEIAYMRAHVDELIVLD